MLVAGTTGKFPAPEGSERLGRLEAALAEAGPEHVAVSEKAAALAGLATELTSVQQVPVSPSAG